MTTFPTVFPIRNGRSNDAFEKFDNGLRESFLNEGCVEIQAPSLINRAVLEQAEYLAAFPQLVMGATTSADPNADTESLFQPDNLAQPEWFLSPAVCYHTYAHFSGRCLEKPMRVTSRGLCYRNEERTLHPGRRQMEFAMREVVLLGDAASIARDIAPYHEWIADLATKLGLKGRWEPASDPFFLPKAPGKAAMQKLLGTKDEFVVDTHHGPLAMASINRHRVFFGERFSITHNEADPIHTACIAFGLDRWVAQLNPHEYD